MKIITHLFPKNNHRSILFFALLGLAVSFSSCKTHFDDNEQQIGAGLSVNNAGAKLSSADFYLGNSKFNYNALLYGQKTDYATVYPGTASGTVTVSGTSKSLYTANFNLTAGQYHSLYILSKGDSTGFVVVKDEFIVPTAGKAKIRFANLSSDSPSYNLELVGDTATFTDRTYKSFTAFKEVTPSSKYTLLLKNKASSATVATLENVEIASGKFYTVYAKGLVTTTVDAQKLALQVSLH